MTKKQRRVLSRILLAFGLFLAVRIAEHFIALPALAAFILYMIPYGIIGHDVLRKAFSGIAHGALMDESFLMGVATLGAILLGEYGEAVAVMLFYQTGELLQSYAVGKSRKNIAALMDIRPDWAYLWKDGEIEQVDPEEVAVGDCIVIRPGERIPLDGVVLEGSSALNTSALTGESLPRQVGPGDSVISGCVNDSGLLRVRVTKPFEESTVNRILELVENSSLKKAKAENFIARFARWYTPAVCGAALALAVLPPLLLHGSWPLWLSRALTFLVISCPCALVISVPLSFFGCIGGAGKAGILVKGGNYLEALARVKTVVFDKTGTLTRGVFEVSGLFPVPGINESLLLEIAALAESYSNHPISRSLLNALDQSPDSNRVSDVQELAGRGVTALVDGHPAAVGSHRLMEEQGISYVPCREPGTHVYVALDNRFLGCILVSDQPKATAKAAIDMLNSHRIRTVMLTGDQEDAARRVGEDLGISEVYSQLLPADKVEKLEQLLVENSGSSTLAFVGDGINDAPVLSRADVGIAMGALGSDAAIEAADIVLMDDDPAKVAAAIHLARRCLTIVRQNIIFILVIKAVCLILGALGLAGMEAAIFADVGVMLLAVLNASRTLRVPKAASASSQAAIPETT